MEQRKSKLIFEDLYERGMKMHKDEIAAKEKKEDENLFAEWFRTLMAPKVQTGKQNVVDRSEDEGSEDDSYDEYAFLRDDSPQSRTKKVVEEEMGEGPSFEYALYSNSSPQPITHIGKVQEPESKKKNNEKSKSNKENSNLKSRKIPDEKLSPNNTRSSRSDTPKRLSFGGAIEYEDNYEPDLSYDNPQEEQENESKKKTKKEEKENEKSKKNRGNKSNKLIEKEEKENVITRKRPAEKPKSNESLKRQRRQSVALTPAKAKTYTLGESTEVVEATQYEGAMFTRRERRRPIAPVRFWKGERVEYSHSHTPVKVVYMSNATSTTPGKRKNPSRSTTV